MAFEMALKYEIQNIIKILPANILRILQNLKQISNVKILPQTVVVAARVALLQKRYVRLQKILKQIRHPIMPSRQRRWFF